MWSTYTIFQVQYAISWVHSIPPTSIFIVSLFLLLLFCRFLQKDCWNKSSRANITFCVWNWVYIWLGTKLRIRYFNSPPPSNMFYFCQLISILLNILNNPSIIASFINCVNLKYVILLSEMLEFKKLLRIKLLPTNKKDNFWVFFNVLLFQID